MGPMGPQGPQEGTGSLPGGSPGQGEHGEEVRGDFWKTRFLGLRRPPLKPGKTASKQAPQPPGPISIAPFYFFAPGGCRKSLESLRGGPFRAKTKAGGLQEFRAFLGFRFFWGFGFFGVSGFLGFRVF